MATRTIAATELEQAAVAFVDAVRKSDRLYRSSRFEDYLMEEEIDLWTCLKRAVREAKRDLA